MSGHSKWSTIKHKKGALDKKRGKIFSKVIREILASVKLGGGGQPESNPRLRQAIASARAVNMPSDTIQKAIKKASGESNTTNFETTFYEGLAPSNVAVIVKCLTDNKNRTVASIRSIFSKGGGFMGDTNSVSFLFKEVGCITLAKEQITEEDLADLVIDAGGEDYAEKEETYEIYTEPKNLHQVYSYLETAPKNKIEVSSANLQFISQTPAPIDDIQAANKILILLENLEDNDDVQEIYTNFEPSVNIQEQLNRL